MSALALAGCGSSGDSSSSDDQGKTSYKVALVISGPKNDGGWGQGHYESLQSAVASHGNWEMLEPKENTDSADAASAAQSYVDQDVDLIIAAGNEFVSAWGDVVAEAAQSNPKVHFLMTNTDPTTDLADYETLENVETVQVNLKQTGSLAGVVAGLMTNTGQIGFIGGMRLPTTLTKYAAYLAAAQKVNPAIEGHYNFDAGFTDASFGTNITEQWINTNNVDVMWGDASAVDNGARQALQDAGADTHFDIAQPIDSVGSDNPTVVTSTVTDWMFGQAMDDVESGSFGNGNVIEANMANGGVYLGKFSDKVSSDVQSKIQDYAQQIQDDAFLTDDEVAAVKSTL
ncbi:MAG: BMP family protein [Atopobiaceae bacterium]